MNNNEKHLGKMTMARHVENNENNEEIKRKLMKSNVQKGNMMTHARVNALCKRTAGGWGGTNPPPNCKTWTKIRIQYVPSSAVLIWQCDVMYDEKRMNMIN